MAQQCVTVAAASTNKLQAASLEQYRELVTEFHLKQRDSWIKHLLKRGVTEADAEDVFSSVVEYLLNSETYKKYLERCKSIGSSIYKYNPKMKGLKKLPCFIRLVYRVFKTKISNYFRGCKRQLNALRAYFYTISTGNKIKGTPTLRVDEQSDPEKLLIEAEEKSSAPSGEVIVFVQNTNNAEKQFNQQAA